MRFIATALAVGLVALAAPAAAQKWPERAVRLVVPYPPGGNVDVAARLIAPGLNEAFGQPFVVDNKAGAGGMIGAESVAKAPPDGYTLFVAANGPLLYSPIIFNRPAYRWDKDFVAVSSISFTPLALQVNPKVLPVASVMELIAMAKQKPNGLTMAAPGAGTTNHLVSEMLQAVSGASWVTVQYKGNAPATTDLLGGQVQFNFDQLSVSLQHMKDGALRPLAITTAARLPELPGVPTFTELGFRDMESATFTGLLAPAGTPAEITARLQAALAKTLQAPDVIARFQAIGAQARAMTQSEFSAYLKSEYDRWVPIIERANIREN
jgi:tripartite-type tricarboxylate transporter receptor subunit TctC